MREPDSSTRGVRGRVLIADNAHESARLAARVLGQAGYECIMCPGTAEALCSMLKTQRADVVLADLTASRADIIPELRRRYPEVALIVMTTSPGTGSAVAAMRQGAFDYLIKPFDDNELSVIVGRAIEMGGLRRENHGLREQLEMAGTVSSFAADSPAGKQLLALVRRVATTDLAVLIEGETGTGKELVARMLHHWSARSGGPFIALSCKGSAVGVVVGESSREPAGDADSTPFDRASRGTLFIDEIAEASPPLQAELARFLDEAEAGGAGAKSDRGLDVRIVAATSKPLKAEMDAGRFRADLFFRLSAILVRIPSLRDRREDILLLARRFLGDYASRTGRRLSLTSDAERELLAYRWPGNVRELRSVIERAALLTGADFVPSKSLDLGSRGDHEHSERVPTADGHGDRAAVHAAATHVEALAASTPATAQVPASAAEAAPEPAAPEAEPQSAPAAETETLQECLDKAARVRIKAALEATAGNRAEAAKALDIDGPTLNRLIKRLGL